MRFYAVAVAGMLMAAVAGSARAGTYSNVYVFGDSLSDNGNVAEGLYQQNLPNPPGFNNSFTNGPVAAAVLASDLGVTLRPSLWVTGFQDTHNLYNGPSFVPGTNYAVGGATAASTSVGGFAGINLPQQVAAYGALTGGTADPTALYTLMIGSNDVVNAATGGSGTAALTSGVQTEIGTIQALAAAGAQHFLVVNVPNIGVTPEFAQNNPTLAATATAYSQTYNAQLHAGLATLALGGTDIHEFDLYSLSSSILANAASYGLTNTTDPYYLNTPLSGTTGVVTDSIEHYAFWDELHPTATVQALWGSALAGAVNVPEPASLGLMVGGLAVLLRRRR